MYVFIPSRNAAFPPFWWLLRFLSLSLVLSNLKTTCFGVFFSQYVLSLGVIELLGSGSSQTTSNLGTSNFYQYVFKYSLFFFLSSPQSPLRMCQAVCSCFIAHGNGVFFFFKWRFFFSLCFLWIVSNPTSASSLFFSSAASNLPQIPPCVFFISDTDCCLPLEVWVLYLKQIYLW